jgi:hypothetical protein
MYGLEYSDTEDRQFVNLFLNACVNRAHFWLAGVTKCYENDALSLSLITGQQEYSLDASVIEPQVRTFRYVPTGSSTYVRLPFCLYESFLDKYVALENVAAGTPVGFAIRAGDPDAPTKKIFVVPALNSAGTLKYGAWVYPSLLVNDNDPINLPDPDVQRLYSAVCWQMANYEASRGRPDAPVELWAGKSRIDAAEFHRLTRQATREPARTAETLASPLADAMERMRPATLGV